MYEKLFQQNERLFGPVGEIFALQTQAAETLAKKHSSVMSDLWQQSVTLWQTLPVQTDLETIVKIQQEYWDGVNGALREWAEETQDTLEMTNDRISTLLHKAVPNTMEVASAVTRTATAKTAAPLKKAVAAADKSAASVKSATKAVMSAGKKAASTKPAASHAAASPSKAAPSKSEATKTSAKAASKAAPSKTDSVKAEPKSDHASDKGAAKVADSKSASDKSAPAKSAASEGSTPTSQAHH